MHRVVAPIETEQVFQMSLPFHEQTPRIGDPGGGSMWGLRLNQIR